MPRTGRHGGVSSRRSGSGSRRPRRASGRTGRAAGSGRIRRTRGWIPAPAGPPARVAAAASEISRGRNETRTVRVLPAPQDTGFEGAQQALLIERYVTYKKKGQWHTRAEAVLYLTSLSADETTPEDLLAHVRGHWRGGHTTRPPHPVLKKNKTPHPPPNRPPNSSPPPT